MKNLLIISITVCLTLGFTRSAWALHDGDHGGGLIDRTFKIGKAGDVNIGRDVKVGNQFVKRGKYTLTHRQENQRHVFVLTEINKENNASSSTRN